MKEIDKNAPDIVQQENKSLDIGNSLLDIGYSKKQCRMPREQTIHRGKSLLAFSHFLAYSLLDIRDSKI